MPAHCLVRGEFSPRSGVHGVHDGINFELRLPLAWNGRFQLQGGGCLGMLASQRLSQHFDGIVSGAPIQQLHAAQVGSLYSIQAFTAIAPADAGGLPILSRVCSDGDRAQIVKGLLQARDALDGATDGRPEKQQR